MSPFTPGYYITAELRLKDPARLDEACKALADLCSATLQEPGCTIFQLHQDAARAVSILMKTFPASAAFSRSRHTRESGCPVATLTGRRCRLPIPSRAQGWRWMPAFAGMTKATCEMAMPVSGQVLDLSTLKQNTL